MIADFYAQGYWGPFPQIVLLNEEEIPHIEILVFAILMIIKVIY